MTVQERSIGDVTILDVGGRITVQEGATRLAQPLTRLLNNPRPQILINMADVSYIDSTALGELVRAYSGAAKRDGAMKLLHVPGPVRQLLTLTRLAGVFELFDSEAEALASFGSASSSQ